MMQAIARFILRIFGWQAELAVQMVARCVLVGAPHTTNWDFPLAILGMAAMGIKFGGKTYTFSLATGNFYAFTRRHSP